MKIFDWMVVSCPLLSIALSMLTTNYWIILFPIYFPLSIILIFILSFGGLVYTGKFLDFVAKKLGAI